MKTSAAVLLSSLFAALLSPPIVAQSPDEAKAWNEPVEPFRIAGNLYYVGVQGVAAYLIATPEGHVLIDGGLPETARRIEANLQWLHFQLKDVKILLNSHAHFDHAGGLAALKAQSGARLLASAKDAPLLEAGGRGDFLFGDSMTFPPVKVDRTIRDGETISLGGATLTAHLTPGHTRGCTSWEIAVQDDGIPRRAIVLCSLSLLPQARLTRKPSYPGIAADFKRSYALLKALPCDIFLASHPSFSDLLEKRQIQKLGGEGNPYVDRDALREYVEDKEKEYARRLQEERTGKRP